MIYDGAYNNNPQFFYGGSAAQSPLFQVLDAFFGVRHSNTYLTNMRDYMSPAHKSFIESIEAAKPSIQSHVDQSKSPELINAFNQCLDNLCKFRTKHIQIVTQYIVQQSPVISEERGTGGTDLLPFLKTIRQDTKDILFPLKETEVYPKNKSDPL